MGGECDVLKTKCIEPVLWEHYID